MRLPARPTIYEINTAVWLERLGRPHGRALTLDEVPAGEWDALAALPVDAVWLMGVWQRSAAGLQIALGNEQVVAANRAALSDLRPGDVIGSAYCVRDYVVDVRFGGPAALAAARAELADRGLGLILDFVPNHVAPDHPWVISHQDFFLAGTDAELIEAPGAFTRIEGRVLANGRDPYFPPWRDVLQLNAFSRTLRDAVLDTLIHIGAECDGVRCDMAMLVTNEVFARTWGERAGEPPPTEYWPEMIERARVTRPELLFIAEAYWDMEWSLQQQGFDFCYDKRLYDRLVHDSPEAVRAHLRADRSYQEHLLRFIENHDEPRAAATFEPARARAAAVVSSTLQGARLFHDGQFEGRRIRVPVFLGRRPDESPDDDLHEFYRRLLRAVADSGLGDGEWSLCDCRGWPDNDSARRLVAWCWEAPGSRHLVVVNLDAGCAQARVLLPWGDLAARSWRLDDRLSGDVFERDGDELASEGLYVDLDGWASHFLSFS